MVIAEHKKRDNISEYIIYMYHTEDLMRAYEFDLSKIESRMIKRLPIDDSEKRELKDWYDNVLTQMHKEGIEKKGHLEELHVLVGELSEIYRELQSTDSNFELVHSNSKHYIEKNLALAQGQVTDEVQICLNGVYGLLLLRLEGKEIDNELMKSVNAFGDTLSYLSYKYKQKHFLSEN